MNSTFAKQVPGLLWVELKCFAADSFDRSLAIEQSNLQNLFMKAQQRDGMSGVMLLAAKVECTGRESWGSPALFAKLFDGSSWVDVSPGGSRTTQGRSSPESKKPLGVVWAQLEWFHNPAGGAKVAKFAQFMEAAGIHCPSPGKKVRVLNKLLEKDGLLEKIRRVDVGQPGSAPYAGTKNVFRAAYKHL